MRRRVENKWSAWRYLEHIRRNFNRGEFTVRDLKESMRVNRDKRTVKQMLDNLVKYGWLNTECKDAYIDVVKGSGINPTKYKQKVEDLKHYQVSNRFEEFTRTYVSFKPKDNPFLKIPNLPIDYKYLQERFGARFKL